MGPSFVLYALLLDPGCCPRAHFELDGQFESEQKVMFAPRPRGGRRGGSTGRRTRSTPPPPGEVHARNRSASTACYLSVLIAFSKGPVPENSPRVICESSQSFGILLFLECPFPLPRAIVGHRAARGPAGFRRGWDPDLCLRQAVKRRPLHSMGGYVGPITRALLGYSGWAAGLEG